MFLATCLTCDFAAPAEAAVAVLVRLHGLCNVAPSAAEQLAAARARHGLWDAQTSLGAQRTDLLASLTKVRRLLREDELLSAGACRAHPGHEALIVVLVGDGDVHGTVVGVAQPVTYIAKNGHSLPARLEVTRA